MWFPFLLSDVILRLTANEFPELKSKLQQALKKNNPDAIESVLEEIDRKIPPAKIPEEDAKTVQRARELVENLELQNGVFQISRYNQSEISDKFPWFFRNLLEIKNMNEINLGLLNLIIL